MAKRATERLTMTRCLAFRCRKGKAQDTKWDGGDACVRGFGLRYSSTTGTRTFILVGRVKDGSNREVYLTIGRMEDGYWQLDCEDRTRDPREVARQWKQLLNRGVLPVDQAAKDREKNLANEITLAAIVDLYIEQKNLRPATVQDMRAHLRRNFNDWAELPVASINKGMCADRFTRITKKGNKGRGAPHQANACMVYLRSWLNFARDKFETRDGEYPILPVNPVKQMWKNHDRNEEEPRTRAVPLDGIGHAWNLISARSGDAHADLCAVLMLVGLRITQASTLKWEDVDLEKKVLRLRKETAKGKRQIDMPISELLAGILKARKSDDAKPTEYVFRSLDRDCGFISPPRALIEKIADATGCTETVEGKKKYLLSPHDFRRTLTAIADRVGVSSDTQRLMLSHKTGDVHFTAYASRQAIADAAEKVSKYVLEAAAIASGKNVIPMRHKRPAAGSVADIVA